MNNVDFAYWGGSLCGFIFGAILGAIVFNIVKKGVRSEDKRR